MFSKGGWSIEIPTRRMPSMTTKRWCHLETLQSCCGITRVSRRRGTHTVITVAPKHVVNAHVSLGIFMQLLRNKKLPG